MTRVGCVAAALLAAVLSVGCSGGGDDDGGGSGSGDGSGSDEAGRTLDTMPLVQRLGVALSDESGSSTVGITGLGGVVDLPVLADARAATDEAVAGLDADVVGAAVTELPEELASLRGDVDRDLADGSSISDAPAAESTYAAYEAMIGSVWEDYEAAVYAAVDDPELRHGAELSFAAERMERLAGSLVRLLVLGTMDAGLNRPDAVREISATWTELDDLAADLRSESAQPYADVIDAQFPADLHAELGTLTETALRSGTVDLGATISLSRDAPGYVGLQWALTEALDSAAQEQLG